MTTNEIELHNPNLPVAQYGYISERPMRLVEWAEEARAAHSLAEALCQTPFAGAYANNPGGATAAILKGSEVGLTPVTSLGAFDLISGKPAPQALTLRALVQSRGHRVWIESSTDSECVAKAVRRGESEVHVSKWTIKRAQSLGLTNKSNWKTQPAAMLMARATSEVCRLVAADVILGIGYSAEELSDNEPAPTVRVSRAKAVPEPMPEPDLEPTPQTDDAAAPTPPSEGVTPPAAAASPEVITDAQLKKLHTSFTEAGIKDRDKRLTYVANILGVEVGSSKDLTKAQAHKIIESLAAIIEAPFGDEPPVDET